MSLKIDTFSNKTGGNAFYKALAHPVAGDLAGPFLAALKAAGPVAIYDPVGGEFSEPALRALAPRGRHLVIGFAGGEIPRVRWNLILLKQCQVVGVDWGGWGSRNREENADLFAGLAERVTAGGLRPVAPSAYPLEDAARALRDLMNRRVVGKACLLPG